MLIVQKFGGSSVADAEKLRRVAGIIADTKKAGNDVVVVLSAQGDTTDDLIAKAHELSRNPSKREMDMLSPPGNRSLSPSAPSPCRSWGSPPSPFWAGRWG